MSKLTVIVIAAVVAVLVLNGTLEVKVHPEKIADLPGIVTKSLADGGLPSMAKLQAIRLKRKGEMFFLEDPDKRLELVLGYVESDAVKLRDSIENGDHPKVVAPKAQLLSDSVGQVKALAGEATEGGLASLKEKTILALSEASAALGELQKLQEQLEENTARLTTITESLGSELEHLGELQANFGEGDVAGTQDGGEKPLNPASTESPAPPASTIPLQF